jgi:hypothetical protein
MHTGGGKVGWPGWYATGSCALRAAGSLAVEGTGELGGGKQVGSWGRLDGRAGMELG